MRLLALILAWLALASPALASITVTAIGTNFTAVNQNTVAVTTTGNCAAGGIVVVQAALTNNAKTVSSIADGTNTYTLATGWSSASTSDAVNIGMSGVLASQLNSGATVTVTYNVTSTAVKNAQVVCITGFTGTPAFDIKGSANDNGGTSSANPIYPAAGLTPTLSSATEVAFGSVVWSVATGSVSAEGSGFTSLGQLLQHGMSLSWSYQVTAATTGLSYAPTLSASKVWQANIVTIAFSASPSWSGSTMMMMGTGK